MHNNQTDKLKHLEFIQDVITRMGYNSFLIKGWSVTLVSAIYLLFLLRVEGLATYDNPKILMVGAALPIVLFAFLDAYYLSLERKYRKIYDSVRVKDISDFNMNPNQLMAKPSKSNLWAGTKELLSAMKSPSIWLFYTGLMTAALLLYFILPSV